MTALRDAAAAEIHRLTLGLLRVRAAMARRYPPPAPARPPVVLFSREPGEEVTPPEARS